VLKSESTRVPAQRVIRLPDTPGDFERGGCSDSVIHAARMTAQGHRALCEPERAVASLGGRFDINNEESCASCAILVVRGG